MNLPQPVSAFESFLPHRGNAIWVDEVLRATPEGGVCAVYYSSAAPYVKDNRLLEGACLEWMAQSFGYVSAAQYRMGLLKDEGELQDAFVAAVKNYEIFEVTDLKERDCFEVSVKATHRVGPVTLVEARVEKAGVVVATASLKLFAVPKQPSF